MFKIKEYEQKYQEETNDLIVNIFIDEFGYEQHRQACQEAQHHRYKENNGNCWVAVNNYDNIVGVIALENLGNKQAKMKTFYVNKEYRGKKIAQELFNNLYSFAVDKGYTKIVLDTYETLERAVNFYKKNGFKEYTPINSNKENIYFCMDI